MSTDAAISGRCCRIVRTSVEEVRLAGVKISQSFFNFVLDFDLTELKIKSNRIARFNCEKLKAGNSAEVKIIMPTLKVVGLGLGGALAE